MSPIKDDVATLKIMVYVAGGTVLALLLFIVPFVLFARGKLLQFVGRRALNHQLEVLVHEDINAEADTSEFERVINTNKKNNV